MAKITDIVNAVQKADISSMITDYSALADNAEDVIAKLDAMMTYGNKYKIFSSAAKGTDTSITFIFNTPGITPKTADEDTTKDAGLAVEEETGLWATIKGWFK